MQPAAPRIVSLLPSATEIVAALGFADHLVGLSHECDYPVELQNAGLPALTRARVRSDGTSAEIDRDVRQILRDALAVYEVDTEGLRKADPTVIVTQDLCDVCAVSFADVERAAREVCSPEVRIVNLSPTRLADVWRDIGSVGAALEASAAAERVVAGIEERLASVAARTPAERPRVLTIEWLDPVMVGGTWMPELVELAGGDALFTKPGDHAPTKSLDELARVAPDVVLFKPCGYPIERTLDEEEAIRAILAHTDWPATREGRVFVADGNQYFNRPGPRLADSLEILAACVHPRTFPDLADRYAAGFVPFV